MENAVITRNEVFLVEDAPAIRERLIAMLGKLDDVTVVGHADTPAAAIDGILRTNPNCVVLDLQLIGGSGMEVLRKTKPARPDTVFIVLTNHSEPQYRKACLANGASYFLDKSSEFETVKSVLAELGVRRA